jgi:hypothetical protein
MPPTNTPLSPERRAWLALKGQLLSGKSCGPGGQASCAEGFVLYHLRLGECEVVRDFLAFLDEQLSRLREDDPEGRPAMTEQLAGRVRSHLAETGGGPGH